MPLPSFLLHAQRLKRNVTLSLSDSVLVFFLNPPLLFTSVYSSLLPLHSQTTEKRQITFRYPLNLYPCLILHSSLFLSLLQFLSLFTLHLYFLSSPLHCQTEKKHQVIFWYPLNLYPFLILHSSLLLSTLQLFLFFIHGPRLSLPSLHAQPPEKRYIISVWLR